MDRINNTVYAAASPMQHAAFDHHMREAAQHPAPASSADPSPCVGSTQQEDHLGEAAQQPKLVVISNRVSTFDPLQPKTGGLAAALEPVVGCLGALWMGSSGNLSDDNAATVQLMPRGEGHVARLDLPSAHYPGYYGGFANSTLWPAFHSLPDRISGSRQHYESYCEINAFMARAAFDFRDRDAFWVHDYHLIPLGADLHSLGMERPIGFFLHTPWPAPDMVERVPNHRELMRLMLEYDLLGFQTNCDLNNFLACLRSHLGLESKNGIVISERGRTRCQKFPIGIDPKQFSEYAPKSLVEHEKDISVVRKKCDGAKLAIAVDRLDYTKGIDNRIEAFNQVFAAEPRSISLLQIALPSRADVQGYGEYQENVDRLVAQVNSEHRIGEWEPIQYQKEPFSQAKLAGYYRAAHVGVVTPLRDGMNLVAKEYVASQDPSDPGVLVLSKFAGAAEDFNHNEALVVDPNRPDEIATAISKAANMPCEERVQRWRGMMDKLEAYTIRDWSADFVRELDKGRVTVPADHFRNLGFGWINEAQLPLYRTGSELDAALKRAMDRHWVLPT
ncbi:trehalose-6-phosphate synthase (plasmid) [Mesorhizobium loti]|nr:trehalose-6-phosphate synthase [Mesorhizobium loti]